jgi:hypothetical protein
MVHLLNELIIRQLLLNDPVYKASDNARQGVVKLPPVIGTSLTQKVKVVQLRCSQRYCALIIANMPEVGLPSGTTANIFINRVHFLVNSEIDKRLVEKANNRQHGSENQVEVTY